MASSMVMVGVGLATVGFVGRYAIRAGIPQKLASLSKESMGVGIKYYKGGFEPKMSKREASLILGISPTANKLKIKEAHKRIMIVNHPDRGGSPYLAAKLNEAKDLLDCRR